MSVRDRHRLVVRRKVDAPGEQALLVLAAQFECGLATGHDEGGEIDKAGDLLRHALAQLGNDGAAETVADQDHILLLRRHHCGDAAHQIVERGVLRCGAIKAVALHVGRRHPVTQPLEARHDLVPAPAAMPRAMNQNEGAHRASLVMGQLILPGLERISCPK